MQNAIARAGLTAAEQERLRAAVVARRPRTIRLRSAAGLLAARSTLGAERASARAWTRLAATIAGRP